MNFDELKTSLAVLEANANPDVADLDAVRRNVMNSRRRIRVRDLRELGACLLAFVLFFPVAFTALPWMTRLGAIVSCTAAVVIGVTLCFGRLRHRVWPEQPVHDFLEAEIAHLDYQIRLLRNVSWWYLAPLAVGFLMFVWGLCPTRVAAVASAGYFLLDRAVFAFNQLVVEHSLLLQRAELARIFLSPGEGWEENSFADFGEEWSRE